MRTLTLLASFLLLLIPCLAPAQVIVGSSGYLLFRADVLKELALTPEQAKKVESTTADVLEDLGEGRKMVRLPSGLDAEGFEKMLTAPLSDEQRLRLRGLWIQYKKGAVLVYTEIQKQLGFTEKQKREVDAVSEWQSDEIMAHAIDLAEEMFRQSGPTPVRDALETKASEKYLAVLTPEQKRKLDEMKGKPFEFDLKIR